MKIDTANSQTSGGDSVLEKPYVLWFDEVTIKHKLDSPKMSKTGYMNHLRKQAPARCALFEQMLVITGGMKEKDKAPSPDIDFDAVQEKMLACQKKMSPAIKKVQETVKGIVNAKMDAKAKK